MVILELLKTKEMKDDSYVVNYKLFLLYKTKQEEFQKNAGDFTVKYAFL